MKRYVIDACALINMAKNYNMGKSIFKAIWDRIDEMIEQGYLITSSETKDELKDDDLIKWSKSHLDIFVALNKNIQQKTTMVLGEFPNLIQMKSSGNSNADPFLIALAIEEDACIITDEGHGNNFAPKIPDVCMHYGIECIKSTRFIDLIVE